MLRSLCLSESGSICFLLIALAIYLPRESTTRSFVPGLPRVRWQREIALTQPAGSHV